MPLRQREMRGQTAFRNQEPRPRFPHGHCPRRGRECGIATTQGGGIEQFVRQPVSLSAGPRARYHRSLFRSHPQPTRLPEERFPGLLFQGCPELIGALHDRDVGRIFVIGLADDAGLSVRGAEGVGRREAIEADHAAAAAGQMVGRGAPHGAEADNCHVVGCGHLDLLCVVSCGAATRQFTRRFLSRQ